MRKDAKKNRSKSAGKYTRVTPPTAGILWLLYSGHTMVVLLYVNSRFSSRSTAVRVSREILWLLDGIIWRAYNGRSAYITT